MAGSGGAPAGTGGAAAGTGGTEMDSVCETDAGVLLPAPVLDPTGTYGGKTYAEWGAAYDQWLLGLPGPDFPIRDSTAAFCALGQFAASDGGAPQTNVFFLTDPLGLSAELSATRNCTIPSGEMIFIPLTNLWSDNSGIPEGTLTDDQLKSNLTAVVEAVTGLSLQIDGKSFGTTVCDFARYFTGPTQFSYTMPDTSTNFDATFFGSGFSGAVPKSFCAGYWILLAPLSAGAHTIHFTANVNAIPSLGWPSSSEDITYNLTVE